MGFEEWNEYNLGDLCVIQSSKRIYAKDYVEEGIPFYRSKEIILKHKNETITDTLYIKNEKFDELKESNGVPQENDILLTSVGTLGVPYLVKKDEQFYFKDGNLTWFNGFDSTVDPLFIYYWLLSPRGKQEIDAITIGSTQKALTMVSLRKMKVIIPSYKMQKKITCILVTLDDAIKNNLRIIFNLEQLAQTLFKRWFVDFEFPNENGDPYKSSGGKMVDSELGRVPVNWEIGKANMLFEFSPKESVKKGQKVPYVEMKNLDSSAMVDEWTEREFKGSGSRFRNGDTLLARITPCLENGKIGFVDFLKEDEVGWGSTEFIVIRTKEGIKRIFSYFFSSEMNFKEYAIANMNGSSGRQRVKAETLADYKMAIPPFEVIKKYTDIVEPVLNYMTDLKYQKLSLIQLRDTLLPKLLSGEIELPDETEVTENVPVS